MLALVQLFWVLEKCILAGEVAGKRDTPSVRGGD